MLLDSVLFRSLSGDSFHTEICQASQSAGVGSSHCVVLSG